jgi:hypothetical protein
MFLPFIMAIPGIASAQVDSVDVPENAHRKEYGTGWDCDRGYRRLEGLCNLVEVPENAYPTNVAYGQGWKCSHGFKEISGNCAPIFIPANAHLMSGGSESWKCNRGYRAVDQTCVLIKVPANGYLNGYTMATPVRRLLFLPMHTRQIQATGSAGIVIVGISKSAIPVPKSWCRKMAT